MNVPFISSEAKNTYLMSDFANKWHIHSKNLNILYVFVPFNLFQWRSEKREHIQEYRTEKIRFQ